MGLCLACFDEPEIIVQKPYVVTSPYYNPPVIITNGHHHHHGFHHHHHHSGSFGHGGYGTIGGNHPGYGNQNVHEGYGNQGGNQYGGSIGQETGGYHEGYN